MIKYACVFLLLLAGCNDGFQPKEALERLPMVAAPEAQESTLVDDYIIQGGDPDNLRREASELYGMYEIKGPDWLHSTDFMDPIDRHYASLLIHNPTYDDYMSVVNAEITNAQALIQNG
jgi:hypothetical protein